MSAKTILCLMVAFIVGCVTGVLFAKGAQRYELQIGNNLEGNEMTYVIDTWTGRVWRGTMDGQWLPFFVKEDVKKKWPWE